MFNDQEDFHYSTDAELDAAGALELGEQRQDRQWILTDRDVWHRNPFYHGPEQRHPEEPDPEDC